MHLACKIYLWSFITLMKITYIIRTSSKFTYFAFLLVLNPYAFQSENESSKRGIGLQVPIVCHKCLNADLQNIQSCLFASDFQFQICGKTFLDYCLYLSLFVHPITQRDTAIFFHCGRLQVDLLYRLRIQKKIIRVHESLQ